MKDEPTANMTKSELIQEVLRLRQELPAKSAMADPYTSVIAKAYVAWTNTDLTEGRGVIIPLSICKLKATAIRLGKGKNVQGCDCEITESELFYHDGKLYGPIHLIHPSAEDIAKDVIVTARDKALAKAKELGLTDEELNAIRKV